MKFSFETHLPDVEVDSDTGHGCVEGVWYDGRDVANETVGDFVLRYLGEKKFQQKIAEAESKSLWGDDV